MSVDGAALWSAHLKGIYSHSEASLSQPRHTLPSTHRHTLPLHSTSLQITEFPEAVNPTPRAEKEGGRERGQDYLSPKKLQMLTGEKDLSSVTYLEVEVNTMESSLGNFGQYVPSLQELRLTSSVVPCLRDLGTSLGSVAILWMARCRLKDLDGLGALSSLRELYVSYNEIADISLVAMLPSLEVLDVESNDISEEDQLGYLALCPTLSSLTLDGNPLCHTLADREGGEAGYRSAVHAAIPHLKSLDDAPLTSERCGPLRSESSVFQLAKAGMDVDWRMVQRGLREGRSEEEPQEREKRRPRPKTAPIQSRGFTGQPLPLSPPSNDDSSELTHGLSQVICGNPVRALKARRQHGLISQSVVLSPSEGVGTELRTRSSHLSQGAVTGVGREEEAELSASLQAEGISVTRARSEENLALGDDDDFLSQQPGHLPPSRPIHRRLPTPPPRGLPSQPSQDHHQRPKSVADFRHRRLRRVSWEEERSVSALSHPNGHPPRSRRILPSTPCTPPHTQD